MTLRPLRPLLALPLLVALPACSGPESASPEPDEAAIWSAELLHEIGSIDDPEQTLTRVGEVVLTDDGLLLIGQPTDRQIRVHGPDGAFVRMIGQRGEGPGELGSLGDFAVRGDTVTVVDGGNSRVTRFSIDGALLDDRRFERVTLSGEGAMSMYSPSATSLSDGSSVSYPAMAVAGTMRGEGGGGGGTPPERILVVRRMALDGTLGDTVLRAGMAQHVQMPEGRGTIVAMTPIVAADRRGDGALQVLRAPTGNPDPGTFRLIRVDAAGDTVFERAFAFQPVPVPADTVDRRAAGVPEDRRADFRARIWAPGFRPPVEDVAQGTDGTIWLQREPAGDPVEWWAIDPETGAHIGTLALPLGSRLVESRGDEVVVVRTDEFDVEYVQRLGVQR